MKKVALVFVLAVLLPSLVLAWLAVRSLRDQQFLLERQQSLIDQHVTDALAQNIADYLAQRQQEFAAQVESLAAAGDAQTLAAQFDNQLRQHWPLAAVGFCVTASGKILSPSPNARPEAQMFRLDNSGFLGNREPVEVYSSANNANFVAGGGNAGANSALNFSRGQANQSSFAFNGATANSAAQLPSKPQQQLKLAERSDIPSAAAPSEEKFASAPSGQPATLAANNSYSGKVGGVGGGGGGGFGGGANSSSRDKTVQPATAARGLFTDSISSNSRQKQEVASVKELEAPASVAAPPSQEFSFDDTAARKDVSGQPQTQNTLNYKAAQTRAVSPQSQIYQVADKAKAEGGVDEQQNNLSKVIPAEAEFRQLIGDQTDGMLARFLQNKLKLMFWHRLSGEPDLIFGAELDLNRVVDGLRGLVQPDPSWFRARNFRRTGSAHSSPRKSATRCRIGRSPPISSIPRGSPRRRTPRGSRLACSSRCSCSPSALEAGSSSAA
jgi:hypothetical protein